MEELKMKRCVTCKEEKPIKEFGFSKSYKDGRRKHCKVCAAKIDAKKSAKRQAKFWECDIMAKPIHDSKAEPKTDK